MNEVYPEYYLDFKCIASDCPDNCCIGWQICVDEKTAQNYLTSSPVISTVAKQYMRGGKNSRFLALKDGRCPYLDESNLCNVIKEKGENALCEVCSNHPRFIKNLNDATLRYLSLSCPQATKLFFNACAEKRVKFVGDKCSLLTQLNDTCDCVSVIENAINKPRFDQLFSSLFSQMEYLDERTKLILVNVTSAEIKKSLTLLKISKPFVLPSLFDYFYSVDFGKSESYNIAIVNVIGTLALMHVYDEEKSVYAYVKEMEHSEKNEKTLKRKVSSPLFKALFA